MITIVMAATAAMGQESKPTLAIDEQIEAIKTLFEELDIEANACLKEDTSGENHACEVFLDHLKVETIALYLESCNDLKDWRESLVADANDSDINPTNPEQTLERLLGIEFVCGEKALVKRTEFVLLAFEKVRRSSFLPASPVNPLNLHSASDPGSSVQTILSQGIKAQQQRMADNIQQLWNRVELDNLYRRSRQPINVGTIIQ
ncbi:MAG: hypothetical protein OXD01_16165 [Gammaproteobacteria bacterium]|nr:hypothetical protein [Gammaproteobacteria bacterium]